MSNVAQQRVSEGYKQTEVGVIPDDWDSYPISEICQLMTGSTPSTSNPDYYGDEYMFVSPADLTEQKYIYKTSKNLSFSGFKICRKFPRGSILFTCIGSTIGKCGVATEELTSNQQINAVIPSTNIDGEYIFYQLLFEAPRIKQQASEQAVPIINKSKFGESQVGLPRKKEEQTAIANALSDVDALITSLEKLIAKKRDIKTAAMQQLLTGKKRLPGFMAKWVDSTFGDFGYCHRGVSYKPDSDLFEYDTDNSIRLLRSNNVQQQKIVLSNIQYVIEDKVSDVQILKDNDVLICMANGSKDLVGKAGKFSQCDEYRYTFGAFMGCYRPDSNECDPGFTFYLFQTSQFRNHIGFILAGSSINNLTPSNVEGFMTCIPEDKGEQIAIANVLSDMDEDLVSLESRLNKTQQIKKGMMQELLTGRTRLV